MDDTLLLWINQGWACPALDVLFSWLSSRAAFAFPLALVLLALFIGRWRKAGVQLWLVMLLATGTGDSLGNAVKHLFPQPRPCYSLAQQVRQVNAPPGTACGAHLSGMPSNHALNGFAVAAFLAAILRRRAWGITLFILAALVALSRVYLGKHFPSQVTAGALIGTAWGLAWAWLGLKYFPFMRGWRASATGTSHNDRR